jgi:hypothetical protein
MNPADAVCTSHSKFIGSVDIVAWKTKRIPEHKSLTIKPKTL